MKGVYPHGQLWKVNTTVRGDRLVRSGFATKQAAVRWLEDRRAQIPESEDGGPTVREVVQFYLDHRQCKTADRNRQLAAHVLRHLGERYAQSLRQCDVDDFTATRIGEGASRKEVWNELAMLRTALRYGWRNDQVEEQPRFTLSKPKSARKVVVWEEEAARLLATAEFSLMRITLVAWSRGLRRGELIEAPWKWLRGNVLTIPGDATKNEEAKEVKLSPALLELLQMPPVHPEWVFSTWIRGRNGRCKPIAAKWTKSTLRRRWKALCMECGLGDVWFHDLRRSMASNALAQGHSPAAVQAVGGWADQVALMRHYSHATGAQAKAVGEDLERRVMPEGWGLVQGGRG